jgi:hypothetical protein
MLSRWSSPGTDLGAHRRHSMGGPGHTDSSSDRSPVGLRIPPWGHRNLRFPFVAAIFRQRGLWWLALLALVTLSTSCDSSSPSSAHRKGASTTTAGGAPPQPLHVTQGSYGPKPGMHVVGSPYSVMVDQLGAVSFRLWISNEGTSTYDCASIRATQIPTTGGSERVGPQNPYQCTGAGHTIASGSRTWLWFYVPGNSHPPKDIVVLPYGSNVGRMVWKVAGCPTLPKSCLGPSMKLRH